MALSGFICHDNYLAKIKKLSDEEVDERLAVAAEAFRKAKEGIARYEAE